MRITQFFVIIAFFCNIFQINSQNDLHIISQSGNDIYFQLKNLEPLELISHHPDSIPHYGIFWIFGDGTFLKDSNYTYLEDTVSHQLLHSYPGHHNYSAVTYLTEYYSNHKPPHLTSPVSITITGSNFFVNQINKVIPINRKIGFITNHHNRHGYETVYVISSKPNNMSKRILFLYGSKVNGSNANPVTDSFEFKRPHLSYYSNLSKLKMESTINFDNLNGTSFHLDYDSILIYSLTKTDLAYISNIGDTLEHRLFYVLKTNSEMNENQNYRFLAILTSNEYIEDKKVLDDENWSKVSSHLINGKMLSDNEYIEDFYLSENPVLGPHDPNHLRLIKISKIDKDKYKFEFELEYCNDGDAPTNSIFIRLIDKQNEYENFTIEDVRFKGSTFSGNWNDHFPANDNIYGLKFDYNLPYKGNLNIPPDSCGFVQFVVNTNAKGYNYLLSRKSKMKACVSFFGYENNELCTYWQFDQKHKIKIDPCEENCILCNNSFLFIMFGLIILLVLILLFCCFIKK